MITNTLIYRNCAVAKGIWIRPEEIEMAITAGRRYNQRYPDQRFDGAFAASLVGCWQTLLAFCQGLGYIPPIYPAIADMGNEDWLSEIKTPKWHRAVQKGCSGLEALLEVHSDDKIAIWGTRALNGMIDTFDAMENGETAIAFGCSPIIELAVYSLEKKHVQLGILEGLNFWFDEDETRGILAGVKIPFPHSAAVVAV